MAVPPVLVPQATPPCASVAIAGGRFHIGAKALLRRACVTVTLSIKNVPEELADRLRQRAARNHRSLQGELLAIIESAASERRRTLSELGALARQLGLQSPSGESARMIREDRDDPNR